VLGRKWRVEGKSYRGIEKGAKNSEIDYGYRRFLHAAE
jgi:hypothetical protein